MHRSWLVPAAGLLFALMGGGTALAADGQCRARVKYEGPPLHRSPAPAVFEAAARPNAAPLPTAALDAAFARAAGAQKTLALTAAVARPGDGEVWTSTLVTPAEGVRPQMFYWASAGKAHVAIVTLQLAEEGKLKLSDTIDRWFPDFPNAKLITIEDLLSHTGGVYSFQNDETLRATPGYKPAAVFIDAAKRHPADFCPGRGWGYSNTGYTLLGEIIGKVDGRAYPQAVTARIIDRLGLTETTVIGAEPPPGLAPRGPLEGADGTSDDFRTPGAAGPVAASATDMVKFWRAHFSGRLLQTRTMRGQFERLYPMFSGTPAFYGHGVMLTDLARAAPGEKDIWLGHAGGMPGVKAMIAYSVEKQLFVAVALTGEGSADATANLLLKSAAP